MSNPKVRDPLLSESAIGSYQAFTRYKLIVIQQECAIGNYQNLYQ